jgi:hypothetical protein
LIILISAGKSSHREDDGSAGNLLGFSGRLQMGISVARPHAGCFEMEGILAADRIGEKHDSHTQLASGNTRQRSRVALGSRH